MLHAHKKILTPDERAEQDEHNAKAKAIVDTHQLTSGVREDLQLISIGAIDDEMGSGPW